MTDVCQYCLLDEPLISVKKTSGKTTKVPLPEVLAGLATGDITSFKSLQAHQRQPWHSFLTQLSAIGMARTGKESIPVEAEIWQDILLELTDGDKAPWCLAVHDVSRPAFMQPPVPEGSLEKAGYKPNVPTPDELDMLITSRNHDLKMSRICHPDIEHWIFALVTLQTMEGFFGRGNYGVVRMNGGFGNRPMMGTSGELDWPSRFQRDSKTLLAARKMLIDHYDYKPHGHALLWLQPWDGAKTSGIPLCECDPLFIEICRRIRFQRGDTGSLFCLRCNTEGTRIKTPEDLKGMTGDPWTPIDLEEGKALTIGENGFQYNLIKEILLGQRYKLPPAVNPEGLDDTGGFLIATSLVRGEGKTHGFHHRVIPIPGKAAKIFRDPHEKETLAEQADRMVHTVAQFESEILGPALKKLLQPKNSEIGDNKKLSKQQQKKYRQWVQQYSANVEDTFFPMLWASIDMTSEAAQRAWKQRLFDLAREQLEDAIQSCPLPAIHRYRAISTAENVFYGSAHNRLDIFDTPESDKEETNESIAG